MAKIPASLVNKLKHSYLANPKNFDIKQESISNSISYSYLYLKVKSWAKLVNTKPEPVEDPIVNLRSKITTNKKQLLTKATSLHSDILDVISTAVVHVKTVLRNNPDGVYLKAAGATNTYGRTTEFVKDLLPALQLTAEYINPGTAESKVLTDDDGDVNLKLKPIPEDPIAASRVYQEMMQDINM